MENLKRSISIVPTHILIRRHWQPGDGMSFYNPLFITLATMKSRAHIRAHPLHPILIPFPIAFFSGVVVFDLMALILESETFRTTAFHLLAGGIVMALVAAIPGFVDFLKTVPPDSSAKTRAATHAILNLCMISLFTLALIIRPNGEQPSAAVLLLEGSGFVLMNIAGWMGGTLVHRNQIGVDPRYAFAGKWKEENLREEQGRVNVGRCDDLKRDQMKLIHVSGKRIVVARTAEGIVAFDDRCTHKGGALSGGMMICGTVQCPWHGSQFDASSGSVKAGPAREKILSYKVQLLNGTHFLTMNQ